MIRHTLFILLVLGFSSSCISTTIGLVPSTKPLAANGYTELGPVSEDDCGWHLFGLIPITTGNNLQAAVKDAISQKPGADALVQVSVEEHYENWIVVSSKCVHVEGVAVKSQ